MLPSCFLTNQPNYRPTFRHIDIVLNKHAVYSLSYKGPTVTEVQCPQGKFSQTINVSTLCNPMAWGRMLPTSKSKWDDWFLIKRQVARKFDPENRIINWISKRWVGKRYSVITFTTRFSTKFLSEVFLSCRASSGTTPNTMQQASVTV